MALIPWRRRERGGLIDLQGRINTMFGEWFRGTSAMPWAKERLGWLPALNVSETDEEVRVTAELPGVDPASVDISLTEDLITQLEDIENRVTQMETTRLLGDPLDISSAFVSFSPGAGGIDSADWAEILLRMISIGKVRTAETSPRSIETSTNA